MRSHLISWAASPPMQVGQLSPQTSKKNGLAQGGASLQISYRSGRPSLSERGITSRPSQPPTTKLKLAAAPVPTTPRDLESADSSAASTASRAVIDAAGAPR